MEILKNWVGRGEDAGNRQIPPFPTIFSIFSKINHFICMHPICMSVICNVLQLDMSKICCLVTVSCTSTLYNSYWRPCKQKNFLSANGCFPLFTLKVAPQILGRTFYKNTKISSLYSQSLLIFVHKTPSSRKPSDNKRN